MTQIPERIDDACQINLEDWLASFTERARTFVPTVAELPPGRLQSIIDTMSKQPEYSGSMKAVLLVASDM